MLSFYYICLRQLRWAIIAIFVVLALPRFLPAQETYIPHFTTDNELSSNTIYQILADERGFIWVAADNGICRFDGQKFEQISLKGLANDTEIVNMVLGKQGRVWFFPFSGDVLCYDGVKFQSAKQFFKYDFSAGINHIYEDNYGCIWLILKNKTLLKYTLNTQRMYVVKSNTPLAVYSTILQVPEPNRVWVNNWLSIADITTGEILASPRAPTHLSYHTNISIDDKQFFYPTNNGILYYNNGKTTTIERGGIDYHLITFMRYDKNTQKLYVGTNNKGLYIYKFDGTKLIFESNIFQKEIVNIICNDREDNIWIATYNNGIFCIPQHKAYQLTQFDKPNRFAQCILRYKQKTVVGFDDGSHEVQAATLPPQNTPKAPIWYHAPTNYTKKINTFNDEVWLLNDNELRKLNADLTKSTSYLCLQGNLKDFTKIDSIWLISTHYGVLALSDSQLNDFESKYPALSKEQIKDRDEGLKIISVDKKYLKERNKYLLYNSRTTSVAIDKSTRTIWIGMPNGLFFIDDANFKKWLNQPIDTRKPLIDSHNLQAFRLPNFNYRINCLTSLPDGGISIGTSVAGLYIIKNKKLYNISVTEGLSSDYCQIIRCDDKGQLWAGTINGLNKIVIEDLPAHKYYIKVINRNYGIRSNVIRDVAIQNDSIWIVTANGIDFVRDDSHIAKTPIPIYLTSAMADNKPVDWTQAIKYDNTLQLVFNAISFSNRNSISYRYRLMGGNWLESRNSYAIWKNTDVPQITYNTLLPGTYTLQVQAIDINSRKVLGEADFQLRLTTKWYTARLIQIIMGVLGIGLLMIGGFVYYYQQEKRKRLFLQKFSNLEKQAFSAQMNPHFVFNCLNAIQDFLLTNKNEAAQRYLSQFARLIRITLDFTKRSTIFLADEIAYLSLYIQLEKLRYEPSFESTIVVAPDVQTHHIEIPSLLLQPFVENAIRHGRLGAMKDKGKLIICFELNANRLVCKIDDNGIGIKAAMALKDPLHQSSGMEIVQQRIAMINQQEAHTIEFSVIDKSEVDTTQQGTLVHISFKVL